MIWSCSTGISDDDEQGHDPEHTQRHDEDRPGAAEASVHQELHDRVEADRQEEGHEDQNEYRAHLAQRDPDQQGSEHSESADEADVERRMP